MNQSLFIKPKPKSSQWSSIPVSVLMAADGIWKDRSAVRDERAWRVKIRRTTRSVVVEDPRIAALRKTKENWGGYGEIAPNERAITIASNVLGRLAHLGVEPVKVIRSAPGGVFFRLGEGSRYAHIEVFNDGEIVAATRIGKDDPEVWAESLTDIDRMLRKVRGFLDR